MSYAHDQLLSRRPRFQFRLLHLAAVVSIAGLVLWVVPRPTAAEHTSWFFGWTCLVAVMVVFEYWATVPKEWPESTREHAFLVTQMANKITLLLWVLFVGVLVVAKVLGIQTARTMSEVLRLFAPLFGLWFPIGLVAQIASVVLYHRGDWIFLGLRLAGLAAVVAPMAWFCLTEAA